METNSRSVFSNGGDAGSTKATTSADLETCTPTVEVESTRALSCSPGGSTCLNTVRLCRLAENS